jgi:acyl-coenzyme A synthetase/AMP-(fatty) acid ligase
MERSSQHERFISRSSMLPPTCVHHQLWASRCLLLAWGHSKGPSISIEKVLQDFIRTKKHWNLAADGYYWITGRVDDVINVSGHRIGTAEVESALMLHEDCAEAAVVGTEHPIKGQAIYAFVTLNAGVEFTDAIRKSLIQYVVSISTAVFNRMRWGSESIAFDLSFLSKLIN